MTWIGAAILGLFFVLLALVLDRIGLQGFASPLGETGSVLIFSPFLSWAGLLPAIPLGIWALSKGWAGWLSAVIAGSIFGGFIWALIVAGDWAALPIGMLIGAGFAALFGVCARMTNPKVFVVP